LTAPIPGLFLNTDCFTKYGGRQSVADMLPAVWKQTVEMKIACILQNHEEFVPKPTDWPLLLKFRDSAF
jgi:hypothetical protein